MFLLPKVGYLTPLKINGWNIISWRLGSDHFPFFSWVMAVGEPAVNLPGCSSQEGIYLISRTARSPCGFSSYQVTLAVLLRNLQSFLHKGPCLCSITKTVRRVRLKIWKIVYLSYLSIVTCRKMYSINNSYTSLCIYTYI